MSISFYLAPQQGTGTFLDPYRSILNNLIDITQGDWFDEIDNPARHISICCVHTSDATHATIATNAQVITVSPLYADDSQLQTGMSTLLSSIPGIGAIRTKLESNGIDTSWATGSSTIKDAIQYLIRTHSIAQIADGQAFTEVKQFIANNLDTTVGNVSATIRNRVATWMQNHGLDTSWIVGTTTVRQVVAYIINNFSWNKLRMSGQDF